jgi:hypothetical protein
MKKFIKISGKDMEKDLNEKNQREPIGNEGKNQHDKDFTSCQISIST